MQQCFNDKLTKALAYFCLSLWWHTPARPYPGVQLECSASVPGWGYGTLPLSGWNILWEQVGNEGPLRLLINGVPFSGRGR